MAGESGKKQVCRRPREMIHNKFILFIFRLIVGGFFIWAGALKVVDPLDFTRNISNYQIFSEGISFFLAIILPWIEIVCGFFLITGIFRQASAFLISFFLLLFILLVLVTIARGINIDCGCFGSLSRSVDFKLVFVDGILFFLSLIIFLRSQQE